MSDRLVSLAVILALLLGLVGYFSNLHWDDAPSGTEIIQPNQEVHP
jgi:hypothetical protein